MALSRIEEVRAVDFRLEIPVRDFAEFPEKLSIDVDRDGGDQSEVVVDRGESPYPLLAVLAAARRGDLQEHAPVPQKPPELTRAEKLQAEGRAAYEEYQRLKNQRRG
ncbi:MAG: hypothetical protein IPJ65_06550 [Archangiaceae bacterium]|nr:hypothetical protein [Archangiaceae bacterium]